MIVRIQGKVTAIDILEGVSAAGKKWSRKVYTISDDFKNAEYNRSVQVNDFGKPDPNKMDYEFIYKSNHQVGDKVDLACFIETNERGFTNVDYGKPYEEIERKPVATGNVVVADGPVEEPQPSLQSESQSDLPF